MRSWGAGLAPLAGVALLLAGCGGAKSSQRQPTTPSPSTTSRTPTARRYSARQVERAFDTAGINLKKKTDAALCPVPCPFFTSRGRVDLTVSICGDQGETIGADLPLRRLLRKANVLVMYEMHTAPHVPNPVATLAKIRHALALLPGNQPVSVVHLHPPPDPYTLFNPRQVERIFGGAGVPLKEVRPINLSGVPRRDEISAATPRTELQAAASLPRRNFVRIIVTRHIDTADGEYLTVGETQTAGAPVRSGDSVIFNVYIDWKLHDSRRRKVETAIRRLEAIADARTIITLGH